MILRQFVKGFVIDLQPLLVQGQSTKGTFSVSADGAYARGADYVLIVAGYKGDLRVSVEGEVTNAADKVGVREEILRRYLLVFLHCYYYEQIELNIYISKK